MNADQFANSIQGLKPTRADLLAIGMSEQGANLKMQMYDCHRLRPSDSDEPLLDLCRNFDVSTLEIGLIRFQQAIERGRSSFFIGECESDPLISLLSGQVSVFDHEVPDRLLFECALKGESFLKILLILAAELKEQMFESKRDMARTDKVLRSCVEMGGANSESFYRMILDI